MSVHRKIIAPALWTAGLLYIFYLLNRYFAYNYYYAEQWRMFRFSADYATALLSRPFGVVEYVASFLLQFFAKPYMGAACTTLLYAASALLLRTLLCRMGETEHPHPLLFLLPGLTFIWADFDEGYHFEAGLAFAFVLALLVLYARLRRRGARLLFVYAVSWVAWWLSGPTAFLLPAIALVEEMFRSGESPRQRCLFLPLAIWCVVPAVAWFFGNAASGTLGQLTTVAAYYHPLLPPPALLWAAPCWVVVAVILSHLLRNVKYPTRVSVRYAAMGFELFVSFLVFWRGSNYFHHPDEYLAKKLDCLANTGQWEEILATPGLNAQKNTLFACYQNLALAKTGRLAAHLFDMPQCGPRGLWPKWNKTAPVSGLLSQVACTAGNVAMAQALAFEGIMGAERACNPRFMLILVKTNIVYGQYAVAEKYIRLLEQTACHAAAAHRLRAFLWNDKKVMADSELGALRRCTQKLNGLTNEDRAATDIWPVLQSNPLHRPAAEYYAAFCLMMKDVGHLDRLAELWRTHYKGTPLPAPVQQGLLLAHEKDSSDTLRNLGISQATVTSFERFKNALRMYVASGRDVSGARGIEREFGNTYWFYHTFFKL